MKTLKYEHNMVESVENQTGLYTINLHTNIRYIQAVSILCAVNAYSHRHTIL